MIVASVKPSPSEGWRAQSGLWRWADLDLRKSVTNLRSLLSFAMSSFDLTRAREFCLASFNMHTLNEVTSWTVHLTLSIIISATEWFYGNCFNNFMQAYFSEKQKKTVALSGYCGETDRTHTGEGCKRFRCLTTIPNLRNPIPSLQRGLGFHSRSSKPYSYKKTTPHPDPCPPATSSSQAKINITSVISVFFQMKKLQLSKLLSQCRPQCTVPHFLGIEP